jgi:putative iron-only hydrogenase system regulator
MTTQNADTRVAVVGAILEHPQESQAAFNSLVAGSRHLVKARMGVPFESEGFSVISLTLQGALDDINALTGKLGRLPHVTVKTAVSEKREGV